MPGDNQPIGADEVESLFGAHAQIADRACALAVSGGSDSTALMVLFADWLRQAERDAGLHTVLVVDHGLRPGSADEARAVADRAAALGFRHAVLAWQGPKPHTGIQAAARAARYRLMAEHMTAHDIGCLLTAHTRDDQAETLLMRLARGSGVDGLAAMAPWTEVGARGETGVCASSGRCWAWRRRGCAPPWRPAASPGSRTPATSLPPSSAPVGAPRAPTWRRSACRARCWPPARGGCSGHARRSRPSPMPTAPRTRGLVRDRPLRRLPHRPGAVARVPEEIALRVIGRCIVAAGGSGEPVPLAGLEPIVARIWSGKRRRQLDAGPGADHGEGTRSSRSSASRDGCRCRSRC